MPLSTPLFSKIVLISGDFGDAYTMSLISRLKESIAYLGQILGYELYIVELMQSLVELVFSNCYFFTPYGLYKQGRGYPMGGYSSREALDVDLACSELKILSSRLSFISDIREYSRMVDDISCVVQGEFQSVVKTLLLMAKTYPDMPLNIQISFCYSRFLDIHLYNVYRPFQEHYTLHSTLAWKDMNSFCYQPMSSNKPPIYKLAVACSQSYRGSSPNRVLINPG